MPGNCDQIADVKAQTSNAANALFPHNLLMILTRFGLNSSKQIKATTSNVTFDLISAEEFRIPLESILFLEEVSNRTTPLTAKYARGTISIHVTART